MSRFRASRGLDPVARPIVVEVLGLAGSGKSTLVKELSAQDSSMEELPLPDVRRWKDAPFFVSNCMAVLPDYLKLKRRSPSSMGLAELAQMALLIGWRKRLPRPARDRSICLIDQGPVFMIASSRTFGPAAFAGAVSDIWWEKVFRCWASTIDCIVWLDAEDDVLLNRVRQRERWHTLDQTSDFDAMAWMRSFRAAFRSTVADFGEFGKEPELLVFDSGPGAIQDLTQVVRRELKRWRAEHLEVAPLDSPWNLKGN